MDNSYTPPGIISVSTPLADHLAELYHGMNRKFIPAILYSPKGKHRENKDSPWIEDGPGYFIGFMPIDEMPQSALKVYKGAFYAIEVPEEIWRKSHRRLLDYGPDGNQIILK